MNPYDLFMERLNFDRALEVGQEVEARWTWSNGYYSAKARIAKINNKSVRVELLEDVASVYTRDVAWPKGRELRIPRLAAGEWSVNNGVFAS
jgi:hypothetical protein